MNSSHDFCVIFGKYELNQSQQINNHCVFIVLWPAINQGNSQG